jgi:hypothetical protein
MDRDLCDRNAKIVTILRTWLDNDQLSHIAVGTLASVGRDDYEVRKLIIDRARPAPTRMVRPVDFPQYEYDATMGMRGSAIDAMRFFTDYPDECIAVLTDAIDTFKEYDPDETYGGPVTRVARALREFGAHAAPAALPLARHLNDDCGDDTPRNILVTLAALGPAGSEAIPYVHELLIKRGWTLQRETVTKEEDLVSWTFHTLKSGQI